MTLENGSVRLAPQRRAWPQTERQADLPSEAAGVPRQPHVGNRFTPHARTRMQERNIPRRAVDYVLEHFDTRLPAGPPRGSKPAVIYKGEWGGRRLRVYVQRDSNPPLVLTVAWEA